MYKFSSKRINPILLACGFFCLGVFSPKILAMDGDENPHQENNERRIEVVDNQQADPLAGVIDNCKNFIDKYQKELYPGIAGTGGNVLLENFAPNLLKRSDQVTVFRANKNHANAYLQRINSNMYGILSKIFSLPSCLGRDATSMTSTKAKKASLLLRMNPIYITFNFTPGCGSPCESPKTIQDCQCSLYQKAGSDRYILNIESAKNKNDTKFNLDLLKNEYSLEDRNKIESLILNGPKELCGTKYSKELLPNLKEFKSLTLEKISGVQIGKFHTAFKESNIEKVICPKLKTMPDVAFYGCRKLERFEAPLLIDIPDGAFINCIPLKAIPLNVNKLGNDTFECCESLTELHLPKLRECSECAFDLCENLKYIHLGCNLKYEMLHADNLDIAKVSKKNPDKMLINLPNNKGTYTIECDLTDEFVKNFNTNFSGILYNANYIELGSIIKESKKARISYTKKKLAQALRKLVTLRDTCTLVVVDNDYMLKKMTNNTDYCLWDLMSDLYERDYNSLSEDEKKYRDEEKRILSEINKQVFIDRARYDMLKNDLTNDDIIDRDLLLRNLNRLLKIRLKVDKRHPAAKELVDIWEEQELKEQLKNKEQQPLKSYKVATALGISALGFFLLSLLHLIKKR